MRRLLRRRKKEVEFTEAWPTRAERHELIEKLVQQRTRLHEPVRSYIRVLTMENVDLEERLARSRLQCATIRRERDTAARSREELSRALVKLDTAVAGLLNRDVSGQEVSLDEIDEIRGSIWASYNAASDALKQAR